MCEKPLPKGQEGQEGQRMALNARVCHVHSTYTQKYLPYRAIQHKSALLSILQHKFSRNEVNKST
eukprot:scaffold10143_cov119-Skeletonema_dohrnii-CCMP3373.AAC.3